MGIEEHASDRKVKALSTQEFALTAPAIPSGIPIKKITSPSGISSVYTDKKVIDVFLMTYCGLINKKIVSILQRFGVNAIGLSGVDGRLWEAKRKDVVYSLEKGRTKLIKDNLTGKVERVNSRLLMLLCKNGYVPVLCPPAISFDNEIVNTDNDTAVAVLADRRADHSGS